MRRQSLRLRRSDSKSATYNPLNIRDTMLCFDYSNPPKQFVKLFQKLYINFSKIWTSISGPLRAVASGEAVRAERGQIPLPGKSPKQFKYILFIKCFSGKAASDRDLTLVDESAPSAHTVRASYWLD